MDVFVLLLLLLTVGGTAILTGVLVSRYAANMHRQEIADLSARVQRMESESIRYAEFLRRAPRQDTIPSRRSSYDPELLELRRIAGLER